MAGSIIMVIGAIIQGFAQNRELAFCFLASSLSKPLIEFHANSKQSACISSLACYWGSVSFSPSFQDPP